MNLNEPLKERIVWMIKMNPGMVRTEIRDELGLPNNVVTPVIKELIDAKIVVEGATRVSKTTCKPGKTLYITDEWGKELDAQNRIFN
jgi:predicted transcriptional regulator